MNPLLIADCVSKSFGTRRVLTSASLRAVPGELRVMFGRNGEGKSTLMKIAAGIISPDGGVVRFGDSAGLGQKLHQLASKGLFYLPDHDLLTRAFSARQQLEMLQLQFAGADPNEAAQRMGVQAHIEKRPHEMSGGELRRMELAAVLVRRPTCLLADEPYRGISPKDSELLTEAFHQMAKSGVAVVVTGHEVPTLLAAANHVTWCTSGTTYELGAPEIAARHEGFRREYLGTWGVGKTPLEM